MRTALIANIHGNRFALEHVLQDIDAEAVDQIVCLGDCAVLGPDPHGALMLIREHAAVTVMGNVDGWIRDATSNQPPRSSSSPLFNTITAWTYTQLTDQDRTWIANLPPTATVDLGEGRTLAAFHGSPRSYNHVIDAISDADQIAEMTSSFSADIFSGGHTHVPLLRHLPNGLLINPGSVGLPGTGPGTPGLLRNENVFWIDYATASTEPSGAISIVFHRLPVPVADMIAEAETSGMPGLAWWRACWQHPSDRHV